MGRLLIMGSINPATATLAVFVVGHLFITIWWAARVNTLMQIVQRDLDSIIIEIRAMRKEFMSREEILRELVSAEKERKAIWKRVDELARHHV